MTMAEPRAATGNSIASQNTASLDQAPLDKSYYTWTTFFSILTGTATPFERSRYLETRDTLNEKLDCERCEDDKKWLFANSPIIRFMQSEISALGPQDEGKQVTINESNVWCKRCDQGSGASGGFDSKFGVMLCANQLRNRGHLEDTLAHEMIHAYDHMRFKLDPYDLRHAACMEIRAATLSGECRFMREFFTRGQWRLTQQMQECVRRRAALSVKGRPGCKDDVEAVRVVNEVWENCWRDTRPFDEIYR